MYHPDPTTERVYTDVVVPFTIEGRDVRGRITRLSAVSTDVIERHGYPDAVSALLGEALALTALLGSMLKFEGIFTLQAAGDGPVKTLVTDFATASGADGKVSIGGIVRGYARFDADAIAQLKGNTLSDLTGRGYLALTLDQGKHMERYQGIVELDAASLDQSARNYFMNSEQLPSEIITRCRRVDTKDGPRWVAASLLLQHLPASGGQSKSTDAGDAAENWQHARALMQTITDDELLNPDLSLHDTLFRLFHEDGVRVFAPAHLTIGCRCNEERLRRVIATFSAADQKDMAKDGVIAATCEFCKTEYKFKLSDFQ
jgi:molecular chaperone Hsp33